MKMHIKQIFIVFSLGILSACATGSEESLGDPEPQAMRGSDCISQLSIRDYTVLDDSNLIVTGTGNRKYHVGLGWRAFGLRSSWQIAFRSSTGQICPGFSELLVDDGTSAERIRVSSIRELTPEESDQLLVSYGRKKPEAGGTTEQTTEPAAVAGAEVEELD